MASTKSSSGSAQNKTKSSSAPRAEPTIPNYDAQTADEVTRRLRKLSQAELAKLESYERQGQSRTTVLARIAALRGEAPGPATTRWKPNRSMTRLRSVMAISRAPWSTTSVSTRRARRSSSSPSASVTRLRDLRPRRRSETAPARPDHGRDRASDRRRPSRAPRPRAPRANALPHPHVRVRPTSRHLVRAARRPVARRVRGRLVAAPPRRRKAGHGRAAPPGRPPPARRGRGAARARRRVARSRVRAGPAGRPAPREPAPLDPGPPSERVRPRQPPLGGG